MNHATNRKDAAFTFWNWRSTVTHSGISRVVCANTCNTPPLAQLLVADTVCCGNSRRDVPDLGLLEHGLARRRRRAGVQPRQLQLLRQLLLELLLVRGLGWRGRCCLHAHELVLKTYLSTHNMG